MVGQSHHIIVADHRGVMESCPVLLLRVCLIIMMIILSCDHIIISSNHDHHVIMIFILCYIYGGQTSRQPRSGPGFLQSMLAPVSINSFTWSGVFVINIMTSNDPSGNYDDDDDDDDDDYDDGW